MNGHANQYLSNSIKSASKEQLMLMLYDGAVRFLTQGIQAIAKNRLEQRVHCINKACAIIAEFAATLDYDLAPGLAADLKSLYEYMLKRLMQGNLYNDPEALIEVRTLLSDLRTTWARAIEINKQKSQEDNPEYTTATNARDQPHRPIATAM